jgi:hypothetical protein
MNNIDLPDSSDRKPSFWSRFVLIGTTLLVLLLAGGIVVVRYLGERKVDEQARVAESRFVDMQRQDITLFATPLAWVVRKELIKQNYEQIDEYFSQLIKRKGFGLIMLIDPSGNVKVSTDRKILGSSFFQRYPKFKLDFPGPVSYKVEEGKSLFLVPVMGLNEKIGTIAFIYTYRELSLN